MTRILILLVLCASVVSCAAPSLFEWGGYENGLYKYYKNPDYRENYRATLEKAIIKGEKTNKVAPGLMAELGYLALEDGNTESAVGYFEKEMALFPEARPFLQSIIKRLNESEPAPEPESEADDKDLVS